MAWVARRRHRRVAWAVAICLALAAKPAVAVVVSGPSGPNNGNTLATAAQDLIDYGGPGAGNTPGYSNVGVSSSGGASVTYLGGGWGITARHVSVNSSVGFSDGTYRLYEVDQSSIAPLHNYLDGNSLTDLQLFRILPNVDTGQLPNLPSVLPALINSTAVPSGQQIMIGNGEYLDLSAPGPAGRQYWHDDGSEPWPDDATPGTKDAGDYSGYYLSSNHTIRWGENDVRANGYFDEPWGRVYGYVTQFDATDYPDANPNPAPLTHEAQATPGDSGGAVFMFTGGQWKLTGIMIANSDPLPGQPRLHPGQPELDYPPYQNTVLFGDWSYIADLRYYREEILSIVPEPGGLALAAMAGASLAVWYRRRR